MFRGGDDVDEDLMLEAVRVLMARVAEDAGLPGSALVVAEGLLPGYFGGARTWNCVLTASGRSVAAAHVFWPLLHPSRTSHRAFVDELIARAVEASRAPSEASQIAWLGYIFVDGSPQRPGPEDGDVERAEVTTVLRQLLATRSLDAACVVRPVDDDVTGGTKVELPAAFLAALQTRCLVAGVIDAG
jgi:hypothetical protein